MSHENRLARNSFTRGLLHHLHRPWVSPRPMIPFKDLARDWNKNLIMATDLGSPDGDYTVTSVAEMRGGSVYLWLCHTHPSSLQAFRKMNFLPPVDSHSLVIGHAINVAAIVTGVVCLLIGVLA